MTSRSISECAFVRYGAKEEVSETGGCGAMLYKVKFDIAKLAPLLHT